LGREKMRQVRVALALLAVGLVLVAACSGGETLLGERDSADDGDADATDDVADEVAPGCGNGVVEPAEECDDGNSDPTDACTNECRLAYCGDGVVGTTVDIGDGFESGGSSPLDWSAGTSWGWSPSASQAHTGSRALGPLNVGRPSTSATTSLRAPSSGHVCFWWVGSSELEDIFRFTIDGTVVLERSGHNETWSEFCANVVPGIHEFEWSYTKDDWGGDGWDAFYIDDLSLAAETEESCDTGAENTDTEPDACRTNCMPARCGDGTLDTGEECDDGNATARDGCSPSCSSECGDGLCEDPEDQFGCPADCGAVALAVGGTYACAVLADGTARCWGGNDFGQLGDGTNTASATPVVVLDLTGAVGISASIEFSGVVMNGGEACVVLSDGSVRCWGGSVGSNIPVPVPGLVNAVTVSAGRDQMCAVLSDGTVSRWSYASDAPEAVPGLAAAVAVAAGGGHSCAALADGSVWCWGDNRSGQLGDGTNLRSDTPVHVSDLTTASAVAAAAEHSCALLRDGSVSCWGDNSWGQLGDGTCATTNIPVSVACPATL
jgi:cysteine-rich repeat protein